MSATTSTYAELEIGLHRAPAGAYQVELRFSHPESEAEVPPEKGTVPLDPAELLALEDDPAAYGETLAAKVFHDDNVKALYARAMTAVEAGDLFLRLRLLIGASAPELQAVRWELLADPQSKAPLATSEKTLLSRFMFSRDWRHVKLRPKAELQALVAVAAPSDVERFQLAAVDLDGEVDRCRAALEGIGVAVAGKDEPLTLEHLVARLRAGVDVLYLACHGALSRRAQEPVLYLQDAGGKVAVARGAELARRIAELTRPPRLAVLASCESAGREGGTDAAGRATAQSSLAPLLAEAGVPAVIAMQGKISMATVEKMMPVFFRELLADGQIDRALAVARGAVRERDDSWMPALYLRLKRGRIWYRPRFAGAGDEFSKWQSIAGSVRQERFVPILGPDVGEHVYGTRGERAGRLAEKHGFPLARHQRSNLAKVTQFLSVDESRRQARDAVVKQLHREVLARHPDPDDDARKLSLPRLLDAAAERCFADGDDPFRILAQLPASIYVNASADPLLLKCLKAAGRDPTLLACDWRPTRDNHPAEPPCPRDPSRRQPVLYHPLGVFGRWDSLVLTEDDYLDYLIAASTYKLMPAVVRSNLLESSLIFLGFPLDDWAFRVLFRQIMTLDGAARLRELAHVGVQVDPEEHSLADVEKARRYLEDYFIGAGTEAPPISIYWGTPTDFLKELRTQLEKAADDEVPARIAEDEDDWLG